MVEIFRNNKLCFTAAANLRFSERQSFKTVCPIKFNDFGVEKMYSVLPITVRI